MKERPILFSAPMVRALLNGSKTQTRRVFKLPRGHSWDELQGGISKGNIESDKWPGAWHVSEFQCPHGKPGDRLWVREAWDFLPDGVPANGAAATEPNQAVIRYWADTSLEFRAVPHDFNPMIYNREKVRPSIHMPRWASRITLEITSVRVERLQDISEADAIAEGIQRHSDHPTLWKRGKLHGDQNLVSITGFPHLAYRSIWEEINGPESWAANPWVWVVEFKVVKP